MHETYLVYRLDRESSAECGSPGEGLSIWTPSVLRVLPPNLIADKLGFVKNWLFHLPQLLTLKASYRVITLNLGHEAVAQCIVTEASTRFPFMQLGDLQIGLVHTAPIHRQKGLGRRMVAAVMAGQPGGRTFWWVTTEGNSASRRLAESLGFKAAGPAQRVSSLGIPRFYLRQPGNAER